MTANDIEEWDSLMHIHLILAIEKDFDIRFDLHEIVKTTNVGEFIDLLINKSMTGLSLNDRRKTS